MKDSQLEHSAHSSSTIKYPVCFLAHNIELPANVGCFFRIADALGIEKIYLSGCTVTPPNSKLRKASRSCEKYVPYEVQYDVNTVLVNLKARGYTIISLEISEKSKPLASLKLTKGDKVCLILGAEKNGISNDVLNQSDEIVHIPMLGENSSMNVASACSIASYTITQMMGE